MSVRSSKGNLEPAMDTDDSPIEQRPAVRSVPSAPAAAPAKPQKKNRARLVALVLVAVAVIAGGTWYVLGIGKESTDDAQVEGHVQTVAARVAGQVIKVAVKDNQVVKAGDVLVELDKADLEAKVQAAQADEAAAVAGVASARAQLDYTQKNAEAMMRQAKGGITQASSSVTASQAAVEQAKADVIAAESRQRLAKLEYDRTKNLFATDAVSKADLDNHQTALDTAEANLAQARARLLSAKAGIESGTGGVELAQGRLAAAQTAPQQVANAEAALKVAEAKELQTQAALRLAQLNLSYATIKAPSSGVVARRTVEVGQMVSPDRALLAVVPLDDVWVVANFKEDQVAKMHNGQPASIAVDAYGKKFSAHVDSLSAGTGSRFALLPPDNASGNFVKVVQRVPVLLRLDGDTGVELRPGMSCEVTVHVD